MLRKTQDQINANKARIIAEHSYQRPECYIGPDYPNTISVVGQHRDSDTIERSNFRVALDLLGGESDTVQVIRDHHWAVGWVETLRVNISNTEKLNKAIEIILSLENYPILDEDNLSELEHEERCQWAESSKESTALVICKMLGLPEELAETPEMLSLAYDLQIEHQYNNGLDSSLYDNQYHVDSMDERDKAEYQDALENLISNSNYDPTSEALKLVAAAFNIELKGA